MLSAKCLCVHCPSSMGDDLMNDVQRRWMLVTPKRNGEVSVDQVGAVQETLRRWERATSCKRTRWLYNAPHPSISDTSMWDKSIMCLCSNCDNNVWATVDGDTYDTVQQLNWKIEKVYWSMSHMFTKIKGRRCVQYLWKLIWKLAACWGLENVANAFLCWGIILKVCKWIKMGGKGPTK